MKLLTVLALTFLLSSYTLTKIKPDSIFSKLGLQEGDKILLVNGKTVQDIVKLDIDIKSVKSVTFVRNGRRQSFVYN